MCENVNNCYAYKRNLFTCMHFFLSDGLIVIACVCDRSTHTHTHNTHKETRTKCSSFECTQGHASTHKQLGLVQPNSVAPKLPHGDMRRLHVSTHIFLLHSCTGHRRGFSFQRQALTAASHSCRLRWRLFGSAGSGSFPITVDPYCKPPAKRNGKRHE